jgi:hypothetical protein
LKTKFVRSTFIAFLFATAFCARQVSAQRDSGATVSIRFADGKSSFHMGEIISIELSFSASDSNTYFIGTTNYDGGGQSDVDNFRVTPPGRSPLERYYSGGMIWSGGLKGLAALTPQPQIFHEDLNQEVALEKPGHYSLYVTSRRVYRRNSDKNENVELRSNTLDFELVAADPSWQQQALMTATAEIENLSRTPEQKVAALRVLRFLDTPESIQELVRLLGTYSSSGHFNEVVGLAGSRDQALVIRELDRQMDAPDMALTPEFISIFAKLKFDSEHPAMPPRPEKDVQQQKAWQEKSQNRDAELRAQQNEILARANTLVLSKTGDARAETVRTLLVMRSSEHGETAPLAGLPAEEVASAFLKLLPDEQWNLLAVYWDRLKVPTMFAPLRTLVQQPEVKHQLPRDLALRRLYELNPSEARPIFLEEINHPHIDDHSAPIRGFTLGMLPDETLPQFDEVLAARLTKKDDLTLELDAQLAERYSTKAILPEIKSAYAAYSGRRGCTVDDALVSYFLRVDPNLGINELAKTPNLCMKNSLSAAVKNDRWSEVEAAIIARLGDPKLYRAQEAAQTLAKYGSAQSEKVMWERLRAFHTQWAERGDELVWKIASPAPMPEEVVDAINFQSGLAAAFASAQSWFLSNEKITALENLMLGQEKNEVALWHWTSPFHMSVYFIDGHIDARIGQYTTTDITLLQAKLAQYPAGTIFSLYANGPADQLARALAPIREVAASHSLDVEIEPDHP